MIRVTGNAAVSRARSHMCNIHTRVLVYDNAERYLTLWNAIRASTVRRERRLPHRTTPSCTQTHVSTRTHTYPHSPVSSMSTLRLPRISSALLRFMNAHNWLSATRLCITRTHTCTHTRVQFHAMATKRQARRHYTHKPSHHPIPCMATTLHCTTSHHPHTTSRRRHCALHDTHTLLPNANTGEAQQRRNTIKQTDWRFRRVDGV